MCGEQILPVMEYISSENTSMAIGAFLRSFINDCGRNLFKVIVTDFSFAMLHAVVNSFNDQKLTTYINVVYDYVNKDIKDIPKNLSLIVVCFSHMMNCVLRQINIKCENIAIIKRFIMCATAAIVSTSDIEEIKTIFRNMCIVCLSKKTTSDVQHIVKKINSSKVAFDF